MTSICSTAIAFSKVFELYLKEDDAEGSGKSKGGAAAGAASGDATPAEGATADKNGRLYDKVRVNYNFLKQEINLPEVNI